MYLPSIFFRRYDTQDDQISHQVNAMEGTRDSVDDLLISVMTEIDILCNVIAENNAVVGVGDVTLQHRLKSLTSLAEAMRQLDIGSDVIPSEKEVSEQLNSILEEDINTLDKLKLEKQLAMQEDEKTLKSLQEQLEQLQKGRALRQAEGEMKAFDDVQLVHRKAKRLFRNAKEDLDTVLELLLGGDPVMKSILLAVTEAYFSEDDVYIMVEEEDWIERIETLHRGRMIAYHPYNKRKIRLAAVD